MKLSLKESFDSLRLVIDKYGSEPNKYLQLSKHIATISRSAIGSGLLPNPMVAERDFPHIFATSHKRNHYSTTGLMNELLLLINLYKVALSYQTHIKSLQTDASGIHAIEYKNTLDAERARTQATDDLLANMLPANITDRLLKGEKKIADSYENVSVIFVDIVGFTELATTMSARELIDMLDCVFTRFDTICKKHGLEKIKTIGDAYMAVCGAPVAYDNHAERTATSALEMLDQYSFDMKFVERNIVFRIGLHSGSVVAGIIGENKYSYDLWGDAVNTASRMESYGESGKIHVSHEFVEAMGACESHFTLIPRGEMMIKGKGIMKTYFLERLVG